MMTRRTFSALSGAAALGGASARATAGTQPFYNSVGQVLNCHGLDVAAAALTLRDSVTLPANVQYAWPHPSHRFLYVAASNGIPGPSMGGYGAAGDAHFAAAFRVDPRNGTLTSHGVMAHLKARPIHLSVDHSGLFLLIAYNKPSHMTVHRILSDGTLGEEIPQSSGLDFGVYAHQVRATPGNKSVALVTRGNDALGRTPEDPGAIKLFRFEDGRLSNLQSVAPGTGLGFGPRHLDFHPTKPLAYVSLERENSLWTYGLTADGGLSADPVFKQVALLDPDAKGKYPGQTAGPVHVHPNGRFVYQTNRGSGTVDYNGQPVSNGGENNIAVYAVDPDSGAPRLIQHAPAHGFELRTFTIAPSGQLLIAASQTALTVRDGDQLRKESAGLSFYRIGADGTLTFLHKQDVDTAHGTQFWCGLLTMP